MFIFSSIVLLKLLFTSFIFKAHINLLKNPRTKARSLIYLKRFILGDVIKFYVKFIRLCAVCS